MIERSTCEGRVAFAVGTGRSGTHFLTRLLAREPAVASHHERHPLPDTFHRYCRWYGLPVDPDAFLSTKEQGIEQDLRDNHLSFEASAYLSLAIPELYERFGARFALILRRPDRVVTSFHTKGWYESVPPRSDPNLAPGYLDGARRAWHPFSRLLPLGDDGREFESWTRVGRLAWFWSQLNSRALDLIEALPADHQRVMRIEDFDHERHQDLMRFLGSESKLDEAVFATARNKRPESYDHSHTIHDWSPQECAEFEQQTRELATRLGYEWKTQTIRSAEPRREAPQPQRRQQRRKSLRDHLKRGVRILRGPSKHRDP